MIRDVANPSQNEAGSHPEALELGPVDEFLASADVSLHDQGLGGETPVAVRLLLTDAAWAKIAPRLAAVKYTAGSLPTLKVRLFIEAVLSVARMGIPWQNLPRPFDHWDTVYNRFRRWEARGIWRQL